MTLKIMRRDSRVRTKCIIHESPTLYNGKEVQDFIQSEILKKQWIYQIMSGEREKERVIYKCKDYIIIPDSDKSASSSLNWLIIFTDTELKSIRSLNGKHIEMLENVAKKVSSMATCNQEQPMIYFHYPPSVWQLHLHVTIPSDGLYTTNSMQKVFFLQDVVSNLKIDFDFYSKATMTYVLPAGHDLVTCQCLQNSESHTVVAQV